MLTARLVYRASLPLCFASCCAAMEAAQFEGSLAQNAGLEAHSFKTFVGHLAQNARFGSSRKCLFWKQRASSWKQVSHELPVFTVLRTQVPFVKRWGRAS